MDTNSMQCGAHLKGLSVRLVITECIKLKLQKKGRVHCHNIYTRFREIGPLV